MNKRRSRLSIPLSKGFTFVEAVVAIAIVGILAGLLYAVAATTSATGIRMTALGRENSQVIESDLAIRAAVARIRAPYWTGPTLLRTTDGWTVDYVDGDPARMLEFQLRNGDLAVAVDGSGPVLHQVRDFQVDLSRDENTAPAIYVQIELEGGRTWTVAARLGGWSL